jgi:hypothetical protein
MIWLMFLVCLGIMVVVGMGVKGLRRWFLISGCLGVLVALTLMTAATYHMVRPNILLVLWPPSIVGLADPSTLSDKIVVALFEFGGNFILYGCVGTLVGLCVRLCFRRRFAESSPRPK